MLRNSHHFREIFKNWSGCYSDPMLIDYFCKKSLNTWFNDPPQYNYYFITLFGVGLSVSTIMRNLLFNPDVHFRRQDTRRNVIDRWQHHQYSLPYFNHFLRNFSLRFSSTLVDNEPDYAAEHPWGIRPKRSQHYARFPSHFMSPKYYVDDPLFENCLHANVEKRHKAIGYYLKEGEQEDGGDEE